MEQIDFESVGVALEKYGVTKKCPMCGEETFGLLRTEEFQLCSFAHPDGIPTPELTILPAATVECANCGFMAQFDLRTLLR